MKNSKINIINGYEIKQMIGIGTYGTVYMVEKEAKIYVLKEIPFSPITNDMQKISIKNEAKILSHLHSNYVVKYYESFEEQNNLYIIMEYCDGGDLATYLSREKNKQLNLTDELIWKIFIQICLGLYYIHGQKILHRDLKTLNIFLQKDFRIKIGDLGVAKELNTTNFANTFIGTPFYLSPEICEEKPYNEKSDIWALGCILYEMITFKHPFEAKNQAGLFLKILNGRYEPLPIRVNNDLKQMVKLLLEKNFYKRPNINGVIENCIFIDKVKEYNLTNEVLTVINNDEYASLYNEISKKKAVDKSNNKLQNKKVKIINFSQNNQNNLKNSKNISYERKYNFRISSEKYLNINKNLHYQICPSNKKIIYTNNSNQNFIITPKKLNSPSYNNKISKTPNKKELYSEKKIKNRESLGKKEVEIINDNIIKNNQNNNIKNINLKNIKISKINIKKEKTGNIIDNQEDKKILNKKELNNNDINSGEKKKCNINSENDSSENSNENDYFDLINNKKEELDVNKFLSLINDKENQNNFDISNFLMEDVKVDKKYNTSPQNFKNNKWNKGSNGVKSNTDYITEKYNEEKDNNSNINEKEELISLKQKYKEKHELFYNEIKSYSNEINIDKIFDMYKQILDGCKEEDIVVGEIEKYISKTIPNKAKYFITSFHNLIFYEIRYKNLDENLE